MPTVSLIVASTATTIGGGPQPLLTDADGVARATVWLEADDGTGMAPSRRLLERGPLQDGVTDRGFRLDPRDLSLVLGIQATTMADLWDARDALHRLLKPRSALLSLRYDLENGQARQIDGALTKGLQASSKDRKGYTMRLALTLSCPDPVWYDPTPVALTFGASGGATGMAVPWAIPWKLGATNIAQSRSILYAGSWLSFPTVTIVGPITSPVITNAITGDKLDFTGTTIAGGASYTIDCRYGQKTVVDSAGANQIAKLTSDSDLSTFCLLPDPDAPGGANTLSVSGTGVSSATQVYLTYSTRYVGI